MTNTNPQSGSSSSSSGGDIAAGRQYHRSLPPLFLYMETGDWSRATDRAKRHPREVKMWASIRSKSSAPGEKKISSAKRLALHHACFKLRNSIVSTDAAYNPTEDPFIEVCKFILLLLQIYPEAAGMRESRHGCLPLHLSAFASCTLLKSEDELSMSSLSNSLPPTTARPSGNISRPSAITNNLRSVSESTQDTIHTTMSAGIAEEYYTGTQTEYENHTGKAHERINSMITPEAAERASNVQPPSLSVSMGSNILISEKREEWAVRVLNALLDAFPRGIRMDSEGGRMPLHTACAGRATPRVVSTLITAYPSAARHRNKDGFLPLHLSAHWGISHPNVAMSLLKAYPDATFGRNRWERTPLEEALCMAGENGRPHQAALVRSLRKHPSYWTRPAELFQTTSPRERNQIVDMDETLCSNEDESIEEDEQKMYGGSGENYNNKGRYGMFRKSKNGESIEAVTAIVSDLPTLIRNQHWGGVLQKLEINPLDAEEELQITTRGGFTSTQGFTALHYACERRPPLEVVQALIAAYPGAVARRAMPGGALPLHIACTWYAPVPVVNALLVADRAACKTPDELGNLALHSACFSGTITPILECLLRAYPKATLSRNHQGSLPEEITKRLKHENRRSAIALLNICKEEMLSKREAKHRRNRSDGYLATKAALAFEGRDGPPAAENLGPKGPASGDSEELMWI